MPLRIVDAFRKTGHDGGGGRKPAARAVGAFVALASLLCACSVLELQAPPAKPRFVFSAYKDLALGISALDFLALSADSGYPAISLAFAVGECGQEEIHGQAGSEWAHANLGILESKGFDFILSTGGEGGAFTCGTDEGMEKFLAHFDSPRLIGFDFDIEGKQTQEQIDSLMQRIAQAQSLHPFLRWSFTLGSFAASDGSRANLNGLGARVLASAQAHQVRSFVVNLMAMDYGSPDPARCVVVNASCDMGESAVQAVRNLHEAREIPFDRIELTTMLGYNDSPGNVLHVADAERIARYAREQGLAGLHYWSLDRDAPCESGKVAENCSGLADVAPGAFAEAFRRGLAPRLR